MKSFLKSFKAPTIKAPTDSQALAVLVLATTGLLVTIGALNGGTAPTASAWDGIKTYLTEMLSSTWVIMLALVALVVCVWQIAHGRGYAHVATVLGILAVALLGPSLVTAAATATRDPQVVTSATALPGHAADTANDGAHMLIAQQR